MADVLVKPGARAGVVPGIWRLVDVLERRPVQALPVCILLYFAVFLPAAMRPLWFDEISTFHVANSTSFSHFVDCLLSVELSPPLQFGLVRLSMMLFGTAPLSVRLPFLLAFLGAGLLLFRIVNQRFGGGGGLAAMGLFWTLSPAANAVEARPYALLAFFFVLTLHCWLEIARQPRWGGSHTGLALSLTAMFLTHCYSPFYAAAIGIGELMRAWRAREITVRNWVAILAPLVVLPAYIPLVRSVRSIVFPDSLQVDAWTPVTFYFGMFGPVLLPVVLLLGLSFIGFKRRTEALPLVKSHEIAFVVAVLCAPLLLMAYSAHSRVPFWNRYGSPASVAVCLVLATLIAARGRTLPAFRVGAATLIFAIFGATRGVTGPLLSPYENTTITFRDIRPDLPFVTASGLSFLEMDLREPEAFARRLVYLTDRDAAIRYRHFTMFEGLSEVGRLFPLRGKVLPYEEFRRANSQFLVFTRPGSVDDWLLDKLRADGASICLLDDHKTAYRDRQVYEVSFASPGQK